jgi:hypothetical protein
MIRFDKQTNDLKIEKRFFSILYIFVLLGGIYTGMYCYRFGIIVNAVHHIRSFKHSPEKYIHFVFSDAENDFPSVNLNFKFKHYMTINNQRSRFVFSTDHFFKGIQWKKRDNNYIKVELKYKNKKYKSKTKLFGGNNDHFRHPYKWSFRIKTKDFISDFKNARFNLLQPNTRQYLSDVLCNKVFENFDLLNLNYTPINLIINNRKPDLYYIEDHFSKNLIERNQHRESFIFTFNKINHPSLSKLSSEQLESFELLKQDIIQKPNKIIDIAKFDLFMATIFIAQNKHSVLKNNFRMFYNNVNNKVEPMIREVWFEKTLNVKSEEDIQQQLRQFILYVKKFCKPLDAYFIDLLNNENRLEAVYSKVLNVANSMDDIVKSKEWITLESKIYSRYPQALTRCKNIYSNINAIVDLNLEIPIEKKQPQLQKIISKNITLQEDMVLFNTDLKIMSGTILDLNGYNIILDKGKLEAVSESNITITNKAKGSASIIVKNAQDTSRLKNVTIKNISNYEKAYWKLPSSLTFYKSNVIIEDSFFESNTKGDDFVNFFGCSYFYVNNVTFKDILADAIDSDFSNGTIINSNFNYIGNDAIDASGSHIIVDNSSFKYVQDKVISAGEKSEMIITNSIMKDSEIAFVSKDGSNIKESNNSLINNTLDYCLFNKKMEFDIGSLYTDKDMHLYKYLVEKNSKVYKNNELLNTLKETDSVKEKLYGVDYGKQSNRR